MAKPVRPAAPRPGRHVPPHAQLVGNGRRTSRRHRQRQFDGGSSAIRLEPEPSGFGAGCRHQAEPTDLAGWFGQVPGLVEQRPMPRVPPPGPDQAEDRQGGDARADRSTGDAQDRVGRLRRLCPAALGEVKAGLEGKQVDGRNSSKPLSLQYSRP